MNDSGGGGQGVKSLRDINCGNFYFCKTKIKNLQGGSARTTIAEGPNPAWNQQLTLTFKSSNNDFSPDTLNRVKDSIYLHLFDEVNFKRC